MYPPAVPALLVQKTIVAVEPPAVCTVMLSASKIEPLDLSKMFCPLPEVIKFAFAVMVLPSMVIGPTVETALPIITVPAVEFTENKPAVVVTVAFVAVEMFPVPAKVMSPVA